jgi:23S rRNA (guanosine2251-2'-O)-methyltransferase
MTESKRNFVYGLHAIGAVIERAPERLLELWVAETRDDARTRILKEHAQAAGVRIQAASSESLAKMVGEVTHQGVVAAVRPLKPWDEHDLLTNLTQLAARTAQQRHGSVRLLGEGSDGASQRATGMAQQRYGSVGPQGEGSDGAGQRAAGTAQQRRGNVQSEGELPLLLVLDGVTDPHNLGACLRTADAAGAHAVIIPKDRSAAVDGVVRKVAAGAAEFVPVASVTNLARALGLLKEQGIWVVGTEGEAEQTLYAADLNRPLALVLGAEGTGMRRLTRECCDFVVRIPMAGQVESLNVSVAAGVALFEARRQRLG